MQLSTDPDYPGFDDYICIIEAEKAARIFLDGVEQSCVMAADTEEGSVLRPLRNADGTFVYDEDREEFVYEMAFGKVIIEIADFK